MEPTERVIIALDVSSLDEMYRVVDELGNAPIYKVGLQLISSVGGPQVVEHLHNLGARVFYDGKFADIPNTVAEAAKAVSSMNVHMFTVHASAGADSLRAAAENKGDSILLSVTLLSSLNKAQTHHLFSDDQYRVCERLAKMAVKNGVDGLVGFPGYLQRMSKAELGGAMKVSPGVRPAWAARNDQSQWITPQDAITAGTDFLVVGRPITHPPRGVSVKDAYQLILEEVRDTD